MRGAAPTRRDFLAAMGAAALAAHTRGEAPARRPNVLIVLTDDQGYGDLACHGNPWLRTPRLDALHAQSVRFTQFHAGPVCSPTRASLLTGRHHYRTGLTDTYVGRSMMRPGERTLAELLAAQGYRTGIVGKWHLGDCFPMRPIDRGFHEALVHRGGGIAQPSDPEYFDREDTYFDPVLERNGVPEKAMGYCSDVFADAAIGFVQRHAAAPFFLYLAFNAPHVPLQIGDAWAQPYRERGLDADTARYYGMIENIDRNVGRVLDALDAAGAARDTLVVFMTDNGAYKDRGPERFNAGQRGWKQSVYEGGIRVPCFVRWPARAAGGRDCPALSAAFDLFPTIAEACGAPLPDDRPIDGASLMPVLCDTAAAWPARTLVSQWHRGTAPERFNNCAVRTPRYKLVNGKELYDLEADPGETTDIARQRPETVRELRAHYEAWFDDVTRGGFDPPRIAVGALRANPTVLTRQDWRDTDGWGDEHLGNWYLDAAAGAYRVRVRVPPAEASATVTLEIGGQTHTQTLPAGEVWAEFDGLALPAGPLALTAWAGADTARRGARRVELHRAL